MQLHVFSSIPLYRPYQEPGEASDVQLEQSTHLTASRKPISEYSFSRRAISSALRSRRYSGCSSFTIAEVKRFILSSNVNSPIRNTGASLFALLLCASIRGAATIFWSVMEPNFPTASIICKTYGSAEFTIARKRLYTSTYKRYIC